MQGQGQHGDDGMVAGSPMAVINSVLHQGGTDSILLVAGGPNRRLPRGGLIPIDLNSYR
jgi:hypothetical protein